MAVRGLEWCSCRLTVLGANLSKPSLEEDVVLLSRQTETRNEIESSGGLFRDTELLQGGDI